MAITSATLTGLRAGIIAVLATLDVKVYDTEPQCLDAMPSATVEWDGHERQTVNLPSGIDDPGIRHESMHGSVDLVTRWQVRLYTDVGMRSRSDIASNHLALVGAAIGAFDANESLPGQTSGGIVESSSLAQSAAPIPLDPDGSDKASVVIECRCDVLSVH